MYSPKSIDFLELSGADLVIGHTYEGGTKGNSGDDPISKLMRCENQGGFRTVGARNGTDTKFCVLYSDLSNEDWSNRIELETGRFIYFGDNKKVNNDIHDSPKKGNLILNYSFTELQKGNRYLIPPFFVFEKAGKGRDVVFRGLAVPGAIDTSESEGLEIVVIEKADGKLRNYKAIFTILDIPVINREWINDLHNGKKTSEYAPEEWVEWIKTGIYQPLIEDITMDTLDSKPSNLIIESPKEHHSQLELITHIHSYITSKGFFYSKEDITNLFLSLKSKPFVILSGISGTGKTKMVQWFAESLGASEENGQFTLIPIRPDWNDGSDLLGYRDIKGEFKTGPLTKVIIEATDNPTRPYFVLLDEMNLARVEYYFSDILSVMESRRWENGRMVSSFLLTKEVAERDLRIPNNLYIIGTVNMDETTHPFSKKVLDRANTIEFNQVELDNLSFLEKLDTLVPITIGNHQLESKYLHLKDVYHLQKDIVNDATNELVRINKVLESVHAHVGYRVRDEICFYLAYNHTGELFAFEQALDYCILQKILPRISGSNVRVEKMLEELYTIFTNGRYEPNIEDYSIALEEAKYPLSAKKVIKMLRRLDEDGFTSFWIS